jgi:acid phosphatase type 7
MELGRNGTGLVQSLIRSKRLLLPALILMASWAVVQNGRGAEAQSATAPGRITKGPCLLRVCQDRVALMWETDTEQPSGVSYAQGSEAQAYRESTAEKVTYKSATDSGRKAVYIHKLWIEGLQPGRVYRYRIAGPNVRSETFEFRTTPAETDEVRFIVYGDSRTQPKVHRQLIEQMLKHPVDFVVNGGDLATSGDDYRLWGPQFFEPLKGLMERVPIYTTKGNHEGRGGTYEKLLLPPGSENDFVFDYGPLHYLCLDNVSNKKSGSRLVDQVVRDAQASTAPWKFVSYHVPTINFGGHKSAWQQSLALPAFSAAGIDFVVTGHSHQYERFRPVAPPGKGSWVTYITAGGGGAPLAPVEPTPCHAQAGAVYHFCLFHIKGAHLAMDTIDSEGRTIDHLETTKTEGGLDAPYRAAAMPVGTVLLCRSLCEGMNDPLSSRPEKGRPDSVRFDVAVPPLPGGATLTFELRGDRAAYRLPQPYTTTVGAAGGPVRVKLPLTPATTVRWAQGSLTQAVPIEPALWIDCHYEFGRTKETVSRPVTVSSTSALRWITGLGQE